jgi:hypothetical protein
VKFADGHSEFWTRLGRCIHVRRSDTGLVGWSRYTSRNSYGEPVNSVLRVMVSTSEWRDFQAGPFIEDWLFVDHDAAVIIRSRGRHGPSHIHKFSLKTGRLIDHAKGSERYEDTPEWAKCGPHVLAADARVIPSLSQRLSREQHHAIRGLEWQQAGDPA